MTDRPKSAGWYFGPIGRRMESLRPGLPPPYNVPRELMGQVPGTPAYPLPALEAACACSPVAQASGVRVARSEAGQPVAATTPGADPEFARAVGRELICLANEGRIPANYGQGSSEADLVLLLESLPFCYFTPARFAALTVPGDPVATAEALWGEALALCPDAADTSEGAYDWDGSSTPPPRLVTVVQTLALIFELRPLIPPFTAEAFRTLALQVARAALDHGAPATVIADAVATTRGGNPVYVVEEIVASLTRRPAVTLPPAGPEIECWEGPPGIDTPPLLVATSFPRRTPPAREPEPEGLPWGWILGGVGIVAVLGTAIYFGTRGTKRRGSKRRRNPKRRGVVIVRRRRNYGAGLDDGLLRLDAPLGGVLFQR